MKAHLAFKVVFPTLALALSRLSAQGQSGTISGFVRDSTNGESLSYVNVFVPETGLGAVTNRDGYYVITGAPRGQVTIVASIIGYRIDSILVDLSTRGQARADFLLAPTILVGEEVTISAQRQRFKQAIRVSTVTLNMREIQAAPAFIEADIFRTLHLLPGVQSVSDYSAALYVRGSTPDQNLILLDGINIYSPYHLGGIFSTFNTDAIKEAEFIAGGFPARYGGRTGAVLEIVNRDGNAEQFSGQANISLISSKLLVEGPLPRWGGLRGSYMLSGRRTYFDKIIDLAAMAAGAYDDPDYFGFPYHFHDVQAKVNLDLGAKHRLIMSDFTGLDQVYFERQWQDDYSLDRDYSGSEGRTTEQGRDLFDWNWGNRASGLTWRWIPSPRLVTKLYLTRSRFRYGILLDEKRDSEIIYPEGGSEFSSQRFTMDIHDLVADDAVRAEATYMPGGKHTWFAGFEYRRLKFELGWTFSEREQAGTTVIDRKDTLIWIQHFPREWAGYLEDRWQVTPRLALKPGLRISGYSLHGGMNLEPRLSAKYFLQSNLALTASAGRYYQYLTTANPLDEMLRFIDLWLPAPPDRPAPVARHLIAGIEFLTADDILIKTEIYYKDFENLLYLPGGNLFFITLEKEQDVAQASSDFRDARSRAQGLELLIKKSSGDLTGWLGYTYSRSRWKTADHGWYAPKFDRSHSLNLVAGHQLTERWRLSTAFTYATGNPYTPVLARYAPSVLTNWYQNRPQFSAGDELLFGELHSARYPAYQRWDLSLSRRRPWGQRGTKETYIQVMNVLNHMNVFQYFYGEEWNQTGEVSQGIERTAIPMFPIFPTVGVRYEF